MTQATCVTGYSWMFNSLNQSPCDVGASLAGVCTGGTFTVSPLGPGYYYSGPTAASVTDCQCNTVYYSLIAACSVCQDRIFVPWSSFTTHCDTLFRQQYPEPIPDGITVPHYAYLDVVPADNFDITAAQAAGGPESTAPPRSTFSLTTTLPTTPTGLTASSSTPTPSAAKTINVGAIAGGVVGGVVGLALLGTLLFLLLRRRNTPSPPSSAHDPMMASRNPSSPGASMYPSPTSVGGMQQPYPITYANQVPTTYTGTSATSGGHVRSNYSGMPEV